MRSRMGPKQSCDGDVSQPEVPVEKPCQVIRGFVYGILISLLCWALMLMILL
jgi:hypothetical protein